MDDARLKRQARSIAAGYVILALVFLAIGHAVLGAGQWQGLEQARHSLTLLRGTLAPLVALTLLNLLLAVGAWRLPALSPAWQKRVVGLGLAAAGIMALNSITGWWQWYHATALPGRASSAATGSTLLTLAYLLSAYHLARLAAAARRHARGERPAPPR